MAVVQFSIGMRTGATSGIGARRPRRQAMKYARGSTEQVSEGTL
ncbi:hypothetical protein USDA257_c43550 [Sinorhizobium fredii USDA 257]|uniref:Uncharacterized protein n=1 Tax=Sinorhizobium fredii (strain USDA 257) TaxID=1185652 RepID=I3XAI7_SINF2|nr:hypothetical protein USDA257_c43550 [Sinorhizobium fredii USDA 257]